MAQVNWQWDLRECCVDVGVAYNIFCVYCVLCDLVQIGCVQQWQRHRGGFEGFFFFLMPIGHVLSVGACLFGRLAYDVT